MTRVWKHDELLDDLAAYLRAPDRMVWTDMQLGPSGSPRPDVYTIHKSYSKPMPTAFEIKVSRSDLRSDTTSGKWQSYLKFASSVTFAVPDGLCTVADIPDGCGLIVRKDAVWRYARRPTLQRVTIPADACMKLLIDGVNRVFETREPRPRTVKLWEENEVIRKKFGQAVAIAARDLTAAERRIADVKSVADAEYARLRKDVEIQRELMMTRAKQETEQWSGAKREVCEWLGIDPDKQSVFGIRQHIQRLRAECDADARVKVAERQLDIARQSIGHALNAISPAKDIAA